MSKPPVQSRAAVAAARKPGQFLREVWVELHKVKWPSWQDVQQLTLVVLVTILAVGVYMAVLDGVLSSLFRRVGMYG